MLTSKMIQDTQHRHRHRYRHWQGTAAEARQLPGLSGGSFVNLTDRIVLRVGAVQTTYK